MMIRSRVWSKTQEVSLVLSREEYRERQKLAKAKYRTTEKYRIAKKRDDELYKLRGNRAKVDAKRDANLTPARKQARVDWAKRNKWYAAASRAHRRMLGRLPMSAADKAEVEGMYQFCSIFPSFEVDHIIPVKGKNVCGLHTPANLQVIPRTENRRKGNKLVVAEELIAVICCA